jgi:RNA polymerase sigma factor (sigma-70 family)
MNQQKELELWQALTEGDISSFEALMSAQFLTLFQYGSKFTKDSEIVKDCIQDLFLYLWEHREHLAKNVSVKAYLMSSLRRRIHLNKNIVSFDPIPDNESQLFEVSFSVEDAFIDNENIQQLSNQIKDTLTHIPQRQKEIIYLRFFQNLNREQIAEVLGITPQTVSNILQMAFKSIRKNWKTEYFGLIFLYFVQN